MCIRDRKYSTKMQPVKDIYLRVTRVNMCIILFKLLMVRSDWSTIFITQLLDIVDLLMEYTVVKN